MKDLSPSAHATAYWELIQRKTQSEEKGPGAWDIRFFEDGSLAPHGPVSMGH